MPRRGILGHDLGHAYEDRAGACALEFAAKPRRLARRGTRGLPDHNRATAGRIGEVTCTPR
jgi:hypothetical protein